MFINSNILVLHYVFLFQGVKIFNSKTELSQTIVNLKTKKQKIGFVPTMGALHQGHLALVSKALAQNNYVVVSIFVNPTQFDKKNDLDKYPRTLQNDVALLQSCSKDKILVFAPTVDMIYGKKIESQSFNFDGLEHEMEGKFRDGHFNGVGTIIKYLFSIVTPDNAYFGEKDFQQLQIIKKLVEKEKLNVNIIGCEIHREKNGLAMSSRNQRLTPQHKIEAPFIYKTLVSAKERFTTKSTTNVTNWVENQFKNNDLLELEYFIIADENSLKSVKRKSKHKKYRAFIAVFAKDIRLIDNIALN